MPPVLNLDQLGTALVSRWNNADTLQGTVVQTYFCPASEKSYLATKVEDLEWADYDLTVDGKEYRGCVVLVTDAVSKLLHSPDFLAGKREFLAVTSRYLSEIEQLRQQLAEATAKKKRKTSTEVKYDAEGFPKFKGKPGPLNAKTPTSQANRHEWRQQREMMGADSLEFAKWAKTLLNSKKSPEALLKGGFIRAWDAMVDLCEQYDHP